MPPMAFEYNVLPLCYCIPSYIFPLVCALYT